MKWNPTWAEAWLSEARRQVREHYDLERGPALALVPYTARPKTGFRRRSLDGLLWPLGRPTRTMGQTVGDLLSSDHLLFYPSSQLHWHWFAGVQARRSVMVAEPMAVHGRHLRLLSLMHRRYFRILSCHRQFLSKLPNGIFYPFGSTWIHDWETVDRTKTRMLSLIASARRHLEGHRLRHQMAQALRDASIAVDIMGRGYQPFDRKADGLAPYRYSVVIENVREPDYFSEKLIDALLCETVPMYWGCPNIGEYFDVAGMIICESGEEILQAARLLSDDDYQARHTTIRANRLRAAVYAPFEENAAMLLMADVLRQA